ncbi:hypothetical protein HNO88_002529 [Novosphingobium chloroacetimidivorans]|uniref:Uncharacterized protein n=1 Tax=Novosphingobium chloroacetimidivorans TaxID=1428314 RepID=A0A7W7KAV2_9SPHN|nr:hypothetical protein [Novosphingobium chloroacetimidivorans]MBB4859200.1 hypothetical protein [Novosphingobium chloroacetimidivorans]
MVDTPDTVDTLALFMARYLNFGLSQQELRYGGCTSAPLRPVAAFRPATVNSGARQLRGDGVREVGGTALKFPVLVSTS